MHRIPNGEDQYALLPRISGSLGPLPVQGEEVSPSWEHEARLVQLHANLGKKKVNQE
jgi:hypothetical protein